jgi:glucose-6-phosphate 1-dehydrogenase
VKVLKSIPAIDPKNLVRGQFAGYLDEKGVAKDSKVETFAALRLEIKSWRWDGVPFYIRAGKNLPETVTEIMARMRKPPRTNFTEPDTPQNYLRFRISPEMTIAMAVSVSPQSGVGKREEVEMVASRHQRPGEMEAYERLLTEAMAGDATVFARQDYVEEAWRIVDPMLKAVTPVYPYEPHTWGPKEVDSNIVPPGGWEVPVAEDLEDFRIVKQSA